MVTNNYVLNLNVNQSDVQETDIRIVQNDYNVNVFEIHIYDGDTEINYADIDSGIILFRHAYEDIVKQGNLVKESDKFTYTLESINFDGDCLCAIQLYGANDERITTNYFKVKIIRDLITDKSVKSVSEYDALKKLKSELEEIDVVDLQNQLMLHQAAIAILRFSEEATDYGNIFSVNPATVQGTMKGKLKGNTDENCISVQPQEIKSVGKNLFSSDQLWDKEGTAIQITKIDGGYKIKGTSGEISRAHVKFKAKPNTNYVFQRRVSVISNPGSSANGQITAWGFNNPDLSDSVAMATMHSEDNSMTFNTFDKNNFILTFYANWDGVSTEFDLTDIQLEEGTTATTYEPYQESKAYLKCPLRSVPNGVADEVDLQSGKLTKRCEEYVLQASDIAGIAPYTTLDYVQLNKPTDFVGYNNLLNYNASIIIPGFTGKEPIMWDTAENIGGFFNQSAGLIAYLGVPKGTYADLAAAQAALAGTKIVYQLAEEQIIEDALSNQLTVYPSGTVSLMAKRQYVLKAEDVLSMTTGFDSIELVVVNRSALSGIYQQSSGVTQNKISVKGWGLCPGDTNVDNPEYIGTIADTATFSSNVLFIVAKGTYATLEEAQADLAGTIITYETKPELSTIPVMLHSEPINIAGAVKSESDRNTRQDEQINDIMLLLDYLIVVNA